MPAQFHEFGDRFEPGDTHEVELVALGGLRRAGGFNNLTNGSVTTAAGQRRALQRAAAEGFSDDEVYG